MEAHYLKVEKTARFYTSGPLDGKYKAVCFVLHGYGQLAKYFIRAFKEAEVDDVLFIAPEALNRFYLKESRGRVGASWMTKEDRLVDIEDYCNYLDAIADHVLAQISQPLKIGVLGFSQGVATSSRWLAYSKLEFDFIINWAGIFPPDLKLEIAIPRYLETEIHVLVGDNDEYITLEKFEEDLSYYRELGLKVNSQVFEGEHKMYPKVLELLFQKISLR